MVKNDRKVIVGKSSEMAVRKEGTIYEYLLALTKCQLSNKWVGAR